MAEADTSVSGLPARTLSAPMKKSMTHFTSNEAYSLAMLSMDAWTNAEGAPTRPPMNKYTLIFSDPGVEEEYRIDTYFGTYRRVIAFFVAVIWLFAMVLLCDIFAEDLDEGLLHGANAVVLLGMLLAHYAGGEKQTVRAMTLWCVLLVLPACTPLLQYDLFASPMFSSLYISSYLVLIHVLGHVLFPFSFAATAVMLVVYVTKRLSYSYDDDDDNKDMSLEHEIVIIANTVVLAAVLCWFSYIREFDHRKLFFIARSMHAENLDLYSDRRNLRGQMTAMLKQKLGVESLKSKKRGSGDGSMDPMQFLSPFEKARDILMKLQLDASLPQYVFDGMSTVLVHLSKESIFSPDFKVADAEMVDVDVYNWITDLAGELSAEPNDEEKKQDTHYKTPPTSGSVTPAQQFDTLKRQKSRLYLNRAQSTINKAAIAHLEMNEAKLRDMFHHLDDWEFDCWTVQDLCKGSSLLTVSVVLLTRYHLVDRFNIPPRNLRNFLSLIEQGYLDNPYHNSIHAADVMRTVHYFIKVGKLESSLSQLEILSILIAAAVHDFEHPGVNNNFLINTRDKKAVLYNDKSVLENHHAAAAFQVLFKPANNIFVNLSSAEFNQVRSLIVDLVLATDLRYHFDIVNQYKAARGEIELMDAKATAAYNTLSLKMALKAADIGHTAKPLEQHKEWSAKITEEFYAQGDKERDRNLPISPFMDRESANLPKSQIGFVDFVAAPMYAELTEALPNSKTPCMECLQENRAYWKSLLPEEDKVAESKRQETIKINGAKRRNTKLAEQIARNKRMSSTQ